MQQTQPRGQCDGVGSGVGGAKGGPQPPLHLASDFQRQHTAEDVTSRAALLAHPHGSHFQQARLQGAEITLHFPE